MLSEHSANTARLQVENYVCMNSLQIYVNMSALKDAEISKKSYETF